MTGKKGKPEIDQSTEEKIKEAARRVFHKKGFAAARTRDIAEEAGINLALLNYYFRSKEKLFQIIMLESMQKFLRSLIEAFNDEETSLDQKLEVVVSKYIDLLVVEPDFPLFVLSELRNNPEEFATKLDVKDMIFHSTFMKQLVQHLKKEKIDIHPLHYVVNIMGMTIFPFVASPLFKVVGGMDQKMFLAMMEQRRKLVPMWIKAVLKAK